MIKSTHSILYYSLPVISPLFLAELLLPSQTSTPKIPPPCPSLLFPLGYVFHIPLVCVIIHKVFWLRNLHNIWRILGLEYGGSRWGYRRREVAIIVILPFYSSPSLWFPFLPLYFLLLYSFFPLLFSKLFFFRQFYSNRKWFPVWRVFCFYWTLFPCRSLYAFWRKPICLCDEINWMATAYKSSVELFHLNWIYLFWSPSFLRILSR